MALSFALVFCNSFFFFEFRLDWDLRSFLCFFSAFLFIGLCLSWLFWFLGLQCQTGMAAKMPAWIGECGSKMDVQLQFATIGMGGKGKKGGN